MRPSPEPSVTEDEIRGLIEEGARAGTFHAKEKDMVSRVFRLADRPVAAVMTPRTEFVWIDLDDEPEKTVRTLRESGRSNLPVARGNLDNMEAIVGDLPHIDEPIDPLVVRRADGSWLVDGSLSIEDFKDQFHPRSLDEGSLAGFHTVGGLVMAALRRVPRPGDVFDLSGLRIEVVDMDGNRVDQVLVTSAPGSG
jgi:CBS domain containing-hemolysin-like protein